jgi:hypothetical protein
LTLCLYNTAWGTGVSIPFAGAIISEKFGTERSFVGRML